MWYLLGEGERGQISWVGVERGGVGVGGIVHYTVLLRIVDSRLLDNIVGAIGKRLKKTAQTDEGMET